VEYQLQIETVSVIRSQISLERKDIGNEAALKNASTAILDWNTHIHPPPIHAHTSHTNSQPHQNDIFMSKSSKRKGAQEATRKEARLAEW
jgi:hypothetical protein